MEVLKISTKSIEIDIFNELLNVFDGNSDKYHKVNRLISILNKHYSAMIIFTLHKLDFSANWELFTLANLKDKHAIQQNMSDLMMAGIVVPIKRDSDDYAIIDKCWKKIYKHSPCSPAFYRLNPEWVESFKLFEPILLEKISNINSVNMAAIDKRIDLYKRFSSRALDERRTIQEKENNSMGKCAECNNFVPKTAIRGEGYHKYPIGLICGRCDKRASVEKRRTWIHMQR